MRLKDKTAIITGAGSGVGRAGARIFAREGAKIVVGDIDLQGGNGTVRMILDEGGDATFVQYDASKMDDLRKLIGTAVERYGGINILWNHAGIPGPGPLESTEEDKFLRLMEVNVKGNFFTTQLAVPHLKKNGGGSIIFTASITAWRASPYSPAYALSKGGLISLTMSLAVYLGPFNIRTNCICPGPIETPMLRVLFDRSGELTEQEFEKLKQNFAQKSPLRRLASAEDVAYVALFLASDEAAYINGAVIPVDGGLSVQW